jgi:hypothetical protein
MTIEEKHGAQYHDINSSTSQILDQGMEQITGRNSLSTTLNRYHHQSPFKRNKIQEK